jgi:hypothetical protein
MYLPDILSDYKTKVSACMQYIGKAFAQDSSGKYILTTAEQSFVVDAAFLRIFIAWESFLESIFVGYLMGHPSTGGRFAKKFASPPTEIHARELLIGTQKYVDWANPEIVRKLAQLYFDKGEPLGPLVASIQTDLFDLKIVRNAAAHLTSTTGRALDGLATRKLGKSIQGVTVSDFLLSMDASAGGSDTILNIYVNLLDAASYNVVSWT